MKAQLLKQISQIEYTENAEKPHPTPNEVLVNVKAAGICGSDIPRIYQNGAHKMPLIIGHEFAGKVCEVGIGVNSKWIGKKVGVFPLIPCNKCPSCLKKQYEMCSNYSYLGSRTDGGFAEYVSVPEWNLIELPEKINIEEAAMLEPMAVAVHAIRQLDIKNDMNAVVLGLGTIGQLVSMFLSQMGITNIFVVGNKAIQRRISEEIGIPSENYCDSSKTDISKWISEKTNSMGADLFFECVGRNDTILNAINNTAPSGQICLVGNPYSDMTFDKDTYWKILRRQITIHGTWNSSYTGDESDDWHYVVNALEKGDINPAKLITHRFPIDDLEKGFKLMRDKSEEYIKVMMIND